MLMNAAPRLITIPVGFWINFGRRNVERVELPGIQPVRGVLQMPFCVGCLMISSHFDRVRDAMQISPSTSLFIAAL